MLLKRACKGLKSIPGMIEELNNFALKRTRPFGICVGMQLLADSSSENGNHYGLGWISGSIEKLPSNRLKNATHGVEYNKKCWIKVRNYI